MKKKTAFEYTAIMVGSFLLATGLNIFMVPSKISAGGISSLGTVFLYLLKIPMSVTNLVLNAILFVIGYKYLGKSSVVKTAAGILFLSVFLEITKYLPVYTEDILIATIFGGILAGTGIGFVIRVEASTGGSDFAALVLHRFFPHISVAAFIMVIDCAIIVLAGLLFESITITFYSIIALYIATFVSDKILTMGNSAKFVHITSDKQEEIAECVMDEFGRGVTGVYAKGMYSGNDRMMLLCVVSPKELPVLLHRVKNIDKTAFIIISDAKEVLGEGFGSGEAYEKISKY